jgi:hypothetical protein
MSFYDKNVKDQTGTSYLSIDENTAKHQIKVEFSDEDESSPENCQVMVYGKVPDGSYYHFITVLNPGDVAYHDGKIAKFKFVPKNDAEVGLPTGLTYSVFWEKIK